MPEKIAVGLEKVQKTLLLPLWARALETRKETPVLIDRTACGIVDKVDYDFVRFSNITDLSKMGWIIRSLLMDSMIKQFIQRNPGAAIVNIGCGLDTTYERIDNGRITWYDLDLPDVIELRRRFIPESGRRRFIPKSFLEYDWLDQIETSANVLFISAGVLYYFEEEQIRGFLGKIADRYPGSELIFDASSKSGLKMANKAVLQNSGMGEGACLKWGLNAAKDLLSLEDRLEILEEIPFFKRRKKGLNAANKLAAFLSDALRMQYMVHVRFAR
jgi:O-methyltransferase involved in polyketide biosynthesis